MAEGPGLGMASEKQGRNWRQIPCCCPVCSQWEPHAGAESLDLISPGDLSSSLFLLTSSVTRLPH